MHRSGRLILQKRLELIPELSIDGKKVLSQFQTKDYVSWQICLDARQIGFSVEAKAGSDDLQPIGLTVEIGKKYKLTKKNL